jgi:hypothetical protein
LISGQRVEPEPIITLRPKGAMLFKMQKRPGFEEKVFVEKRPILKNEEPVVSNKGGCPFHHAMKEQDIPVS